MQIDRERLGAIMCDDLAGRVLAQQTSAPMFSQSATSVREYWRVMASVAIADIAAQGFVIVPREPSENMQLHGRDAISDRISRKDDDATIWAEDAAACWQAMVDAAEGEHK